MSALAWVVIVALILVNGFYVAAEFALVSVRRSRVQQRAEEGSGLARQLLPVISDPHRLDAHVAACQVGITIASLVVGAYAQSTLGASLAALLERRWSMGAAAAESTAATVVLVVMTAVLMILGELVPKSVALQASTGTAMWSVVPMRWSLFVMGPFIALLNGSGAVVLRLFGVRQSGHHHVHSPEEIEFLVVESGKGGLLKPDESIRLRQALQLGQRPARELMVPRTRIEALDVATPLDEALHVATESPYTRLPVYGESLDDVIGVVHTRDLAVAAFGPGAPTLRDVMRPALTLPASITADRLLARLKEERKTMAILIDEYGGTAGLITVDNILDDLIGDVTDEFRPDAPAPERLPDGRVRLPGALLVDDARAWTGVTWDGEAATVAGAVMSALGHAAAAGERVRIGGVLVEVERVTGRRIDSVLVAPRARRADDGGGKGA